MIGPRIAANEYYTNIQVAAFKKNSARKWCFGRSAQVQFELNFVQKQEIS